MPLKYLAILFISLGLTACQSQQASSDDYSSSYPNILFILADDLGYEKVSSYGGLDVETPNIDALAKGGTRFTRAYTSPVCTPSRMSIYTGLYAPNLKPLVRPMRGKSMEGNGNSMMQGFMCL